MNPFAAVSFAVTAALFLIFAALLLTSWEGRRQGVRLVLASLAEAVWAGLIAAQEFGIGVPSIAVYIAEFVRHAAWLSTLAGLLTVSGFPRVLAATAYLLCALFIVLGVAAAGLAVPLSVAGEPTALLRIGGLAAAVLGFLMLEQIYRNSTPRGRAAFKYLFVGLGGLFAYDLFLFAQAELLHAMDPRLWGLRGLVNALLLPAIAMAVRRNPQWSLELFVSRQVVFYSATLMVVGAYLLIMAAGGYYIRALGGSWGETLQLVFLIGALVALASAVLSSAMRRRLRVFISKHFYRNKYDYRAEWLRFIGTLSVDDPATDIRRTAIRAVAQIFGSDAGSLYMLDAAAQRFVRVADWPENFAGYGDGTAIDATSGLGRFLNERKWIVELAEYRSTPDLYGDLVLPQWLLRAPGAGIVAPIEFREAVCGFLVLEAPPPPFSLNYEDRDLLRTVGQHVATHLAQYEADQRLTESRQFEAYNRLTAFMMHDLKNAVAQLHLLVANAARHKNNPDFIEDAIETVSNCAQRMSRLIEQLRSGEAAPVRRASALTPLVQQAVARCVARRPVPTFRASGDDVVVECDSERMTSAVEHVIRNAQDATPDHGSVAVSIETTPQRAEIRIVDDGAGMTPEFVRDRLFRPFDSTKGSKGMGIGAYQVREYARQLGGDVEVESRSSEGTRFSIFLLRCDAGRDAGGDAVIPIERSAG
jgi:putative PEP-CTERM system histidine kinase